jgi:arabinofuranosyltransferase
MTRRTWFWSLAAAAALFAAAWAWVLRWTCDDAYISFRYAQHLVEGHGLVFNLDPAEPPVEGYSNFAWTMWLALGMALGCTGDAVETWSIVWGVLCHAGTVGLLALVAWRVSGARAVVPVAAIGYALHHHGASLAPAGLETALFTLLTVAMAVGTISVSGARQGLILGGLGVLAALTRPDGVVPAAVTGAFLLHDALRLRAWRTLLAFALPFAVAFVPFLLWRHSYYGQWVPNTYFAKSGGEADWERGFVYLREYVKVYWPLLPALVLLLASLAGTGTSATVPWSLRRAGLVLLANIALYGAVVTRVGGDFMFARFLLPVTPLVLLGADLATAKWRQPLAVPLALLIGVGFLLRPHPPWLDEYQPDKNPFGVSDNRAISVAEFTKGLSRAEAMRRVGHWLQPLFAGLDVRLGLGGSQANLAYRTRVPVAIECACGLTDAYIAHLPLAARGHMPGHDRPYTMYPGYLQRRGVQVMFELSFHTGGSADPWRDILFPVDAEVPVMPGRLVIYDRALLAEWKRREPNVQFANFEQVLDDYLAALPGKSKDQIAHDFAGFRDFYFDHNDDHVRLRKFEEALKWK